MTWLAALSYTYETVPQPSAFATYAFKSLYDFANATPNRVPVRVNDAAAAVQACTTPREQHCPTHDDDHDALALCASHPAVDRLVHDAAAIAVRLHGAPCVWRHVRATVGDAHSSNGYAGHVSCSALPACSFGVQWDALSCK